MLVLILGNNGSGKNFFLTYNATKFKRNIYSNYKLKLDNYIPLTINDILDMNRLNEGNIFLDEAYTWIEARTSGNALNLLTSYLIYQKRKRLLDIYMTAQMYSSLDKRARKLANIIVMCETRIDFKKDDFNFIYQDKDKGFETTFMIPYRIASNYFNYYDTYEIIKPQNLARLEFNILKNNPKGLIKKIKEISKIVKPQISIITHDSVKTSLLINGFDIGYEKFLYPYLKGLIQIDNS